MALFAINVEPASAQASTCGSSTFPAYRIVQAEWAARENHLSRYVTEQPSYSILQRGIEAHVLPVTEQ